MAKERVQRRLAAILVADVVAYSRLMEKDEAGTLERLKALRADLIDPRIAADGGRIVKTMGDGLLVEFPSVVDAVRCAVTIQQAMVEREAGVPEERRMRYRGGVNLGDIGIDGDDTPATTSSCRPRWGDGSNPWTRDRRTSWSSIASRRRLPSRNWRPPVRLQARAPHLHSRARRAP